MIQPYSNFLILFLAAYLSACESTGSADPDRPNQDTSAISHYMGTIRLSKDSVLIDLSWLTPSSSSDSVEYSIGNDFNARVMSVDREQQTDKIYRFAANEVVTASYTVPRTSIQVREDPELIELSHLAHWLPRPALDPYRDQFTYSLTVHHNAAIYVEGSGRVQKINDTTTLVQSKQPTSACTLILSGQQPIQTPPDQENKVSYVSYLLNDEGVARNLGTEETVRTVGRVIKFYESIVNDTLAANVKCLILPQSDLRDASNHSYATDDGGLRIAHHRDSGYYTYVIAHEAAHLMWNKGVGANTSPNAFLNESFAEYFSWLFVRDYFGKQRYAEIVEKNRHLTLSAGKISSVSSELPWGENQRLLYNKGAYLLSTVHAEFGDDRFYAWLNMILDKGPTTALEFVQLLDQDTTASSSLARLVEELRPQLQD